ncbi:efflux RND transporter periplasmic adaptor subunit [Rhizorhabdus dicambivorans]|uniref:Efflux RND transporter periplasmic adaptor subunit n=1 Tax=Rhizorhabdus dicambivorans TaxID=1850238 RepID=A0A2A4FUZ1_9SPHN|nr:efflux RND transporter periplasmic adaptor subunit [Rhizorhabdus dicambivorans]ATE63888.1 efflux RND transporter periplasmic adaptor subunit [Rhizorhabdus dicambivorans]PCE41492.1 efflux RND transporter periplasmic adaptor subunit [Rhizorhabdus dicambivorans]
MQRRSALAALGIGLTVALAAAALWWWHDRPLNVVLISPERGSAVELVYATGFVEPLAPVVISSRMTAPVAQVLVDEGDRVHRGDALLILDDRDLRGSLDEVRAHAAQAILAEARAQTLYRQGWITRAAFDLAAANGRAARAATEGARARLDQAVIRSTIEGIVTRRDVEAGNLATPGQILMTIGDPSRVRITATVDERDIGRISSGQLAWISNDSWGDHRVAARVSALTPSGDPDQRAFRVRLSPGGRLLPIGMSVEVNIVTRQRDHALLLPTSAVAGTFAWISRAGRATRRRLLLGIIGSDKVEIIDGLEADDRVIDRPPPELTEGRRLRAAR